MVEHRFHCAAVHCQACPLAGECVRKPASGRTIKRLEGQELLDAQRDRMKEPETQTLYRRRSSTIERAFADARQHRNVERFHGRGLFRARAETGLLVLAQNILTLFRLRRKALNAEESST